MDYVYFSAVSTTHMPIAGLNRIKIYQHGKPLLPKLSFLGNMSCDGPHEIVDSVGNGSFLGTSTPWSLGNRKIRHLSLFLELAKRTNTVCVQNERRSLNFMCTVDPQ